MESLASAPSQLDDTQANARRTKAAQRQTAATTTATNASKLEKVGASERRVRRHSRHNSITITSDGTQSSGSSLESESVDQVTKQTTRQRLESAEKSVESSTRSKSQSSTKSPSAKITRLRRLANVGANCCCCYANCLECAKSIGRSIDKMHRLKSLIGSNGAARKPKATSDNNASQLTSDSSAKPEQQKNDNGKMSPADECLKCRLIARWTASQADLVRELQTSHLDEEQQRLHEHDQVRGPSSSCSDSERLADCCQLTISSPSPLSSGSAGGSPLKTPTRTQLDERMRQRRRLRRRTIATEGSETPCSARPEVGGGAPKRPAPRPPPATCIAVERQPLAGDKNNSNSNNLPSNKQTVASAKKRLLSEPEVHSIEHSLKSLKSSLYVCGCLANLYFTKTHLAEGGRSSRASSDEWKLNQTGVPVLIFDSGLTKNRCKKRLSISLVERGSAFVLWSDTIDHFSGYRAYNARLHSTEALSVAQASEMERRSGKNSSANHEAQDNCDTFHVMYLSSNHRIMVGLSFDDPICARLFLAQIELVASDPSNIALSGPKLRKRSLKKLAAERVPAPTSGWAMATKLVQRAPQLNQSQRSKFVNKFLADLRVDSALGKRQDRQQQPQDIASGWSTLKRAAISRFGSQFGKGSLSSSIFSESNNMESSSSSSSEVAETQFILNAFRPRPLPQLAATGKLWSSSRKLQANRHIKAKFRFAVGPSGRWLRRQGSRGRVVLPLPRKCDISAPCLFQHVTSVDLATLNELYSRSYLLAKTQASAESPASETQIGRRDEEASRPASETISNHAQNNALPEAGANPPRAEARGAKKSLSLSSSSSCYSSASISPASSECGGGVTSTSACQPTLANKPTRTQHEQSSRMRSSGVAAQKIKLAPRGYVAVPRPPVAPPKPPQRGASWTPQRAEVRNELATWEPEVKISVLRTTRRAASAAEAPATSRERGPHETPGNGNKIGFIIQELQASVSGELVEAKRRLMADIAGQVRLVARNRPKAQRDESRRQPTSSFKGADGNGAVDRAETVSHL